MPDPRPLTILLAAEEAAGVRALEAVLAAGHTVTTVLTGREAGARTAVRLAADRAGVATLPAGRVRDPGFAEQVRAREVDLFLNVHSLFLVPDAILEAPRIGSFNLHPGPLPEYAGLNCISWAIYQGERHYGVTLHWMAPRVDAGDVAFRAPVVIEDDDTALTLGTRCTRAGVTLLERLLEAAPTPGAIPREPQDPSRRRYYAARRVPQDGRLDWSRPAREVTRLVRACDYGPFPSPWGRPTTTLGGLEVSVLSAEPTGRLAGAAPGTLEIDPGGKVSVAAADEWVTLKRVALPGGPGLPAREVFRSLTPDP